MTFLRNCWYMAMWSQDLEPGRIIARRILDEPLALYREADGAVRALVDACPHRFAPLSLGKLLPSGHLQCGYHGLEFDGSGACVRNPHASGRIPTNAFVKSYPVLDKHSALWIWMGDQPADPALIPDFSLLETSSASIVSKREWMRMQANYMLINENLLDLSHASILHGGILGNDEMIPAAIEARQEGRSLFVTRWMPNVPAPALYDQLFNRDGGIVDIWADQRFDVPGCFLNDTGATNPGAPRAQGTGVFGTHFLTPETGSTTHYHFAAVRQNPRTWGEPIDSELRQIVTELRRRAFEEEDKAMIDAQQRNFDDPAIDTDHPVALEVDAGPARCRRLMGELIRQEAAGAQAPT
jgi:phenylpropionate dioxygenase-like ring-hydroxylating dioxygenase large terminal subunit